MLHHTLKSIRKRAHDKLGLRGIVGMGNKKYEHNTNFFAEIKPLVSYWAGFIAGDGCLHKEVEKLSVSLAPKDRTHLDALRTTIGFTGPLYDHPRKNSPSVSLQICGAKKLLHDLGINYNITPHKSLTLKPPDDLDLPNSLAFIAGLIDSDGCVFTASSQRVYCYPMIRLTGTYAVLSWVKGIADDIAPHRPSYQCQASVLTSEPSIARYNMTGHRAIQFAQYVLDLGLPLMERKWSIIRPFLQPELPLQF
jgi:hypothetical protein